MIATSHRRPLRLEEREKQMANYNLKHVKGQSFYGSDRVSTLLSEVTGFISALEQDENALGVTVLDISVDYSDDTGNPYLTLYYEQV